MDRSQIRKKFDSQGISISDWAIAHGFKREQVYAVLNGRTCGRRGAAHRIAVALGLKPAPDSSEQGTLSIPDEGGRVG